MRAPFADDRFGARLRGHDAHRGSHWSEDFSLSRAERQVRTQDDLDIVLAVRRTRRLAQELANAADVPAHAERLENKVLGNAVLWLQVLDPEVAC